MAGWTRWERDRIVELVEQGAPSWLMHQSVNQSRHAVRRYVLRLKRVPKPVPLRLRLSLVEREEISRGLASGESLRRSWTHARGSGQEWPQPMPLLR